MGLILRAKPARQDAVCPYCRDRLDVSRPLRCKGCSTAYHRACARELERCGTLGCERRLPLPRPSRSARYLNRQDLEAELREERRRVDWEWLASAFGVGELFRRRRRGLWATAQPWVLAISVLLFVAGLVCSYSEVHEPAKWCLVFALPGLFALNVNWDDR